MRFKHLKPGEMRASPAVLLPHLRLIGALLSQAVVDMRSDDPILALDAMLFWLSDDARIYLDALGFSVPDPWDVVLLEVAGGEKSYVGRTGICRT